MKNLELGEVDFSQIPLINTYGEIMIYGKISMAIASAVMAIAQRPVASKGFALGLMGVDLLHKIWGFAEFCENNDPAALAGLAFHSVIQSILFYFSVEIAGWINDKKADQEKKLSDAVDNKLSGFKSVLSKIGGGLQKCFRTIFGWKYLPLLLLLLSIYCNPSLLVSPVMLFSVALNGFGVPNLFENENGESLMSMLSEALPDWDAFGEREIRLAMMLISSISLGFFLQIAGASKSVSQAKQEGSKILGMLKGKSDGMFITTKVVKACGLFNLFLALGGCFVFLSKTGFENIGLELIWQVVGSSSPIRGISSLALEPFLDNPYEYGPPRIGEDGTTYVDANDPITP